MCMHLQQSAHTEHKGTHALCRHMPTISHDQAHSCATQVPHMPTHAPVAHRDHGVRAQVEAAGDEVLERLAYVACGCCRVGGVWQAGQASAKVGGRAARARARRRAGEGRTAAPWCRRHAKWREAAAAPWGACPLRRALCSATSKPASRGATQSKLAAATRRRRRGCHPRRQTALTRESRVPQGPAPQGVCRVVRHVWRATCAAGSCLERLGTGAAARVGTGAAEQG